jgi:predicted RNase H-like nuclease (RuvC/YqgF family)
MTDASWNTIYLTIAAILAATPGLVSLYLKYRDTKLAQERQPNDLVAQSLAISHSAAEDVLTKSTRIRDLEASVSSLKDRLDQLETSKRHVEEELETVKQKVAVLETDKARLEAENVTQLKRIAALENEKRQQQITIAKLTERVTTLEQILVENKIPFPKGDTGPLRSNE